LLTGLKGAVKIVPFTFALHFGALEGLISYSLVTIECGVAKDRNDERNLQRFVAAVSVAAVSAFLTLPLPLCTFIVPFNTN
jgi:hypothetical protein